MGIVLSPLIDRKFYMQLPYSTSTGLQNGWLSLTPTAGGDIRLAGPAYHAEDQPPMQR